MTSVWLVTNGGDGSDGDEWMLTSIHATEASATAAAKSGAYRREVEEWDCEGSLLTDAEREAIEASMHGENDATVIATLRKLLERLQ